MSTIRHSVLIIGIKFNAPIPDHFRDVFGPAEGLAAKLEADSARAAKAGFNCHLHQLDPVQPEEALRELEAKLKTGSYCGVMWGGGLRLLPEKTALFEAIINLFRELVSNVPFMFNTGPDTICDALERNFGVKIE
ncbi:uncharacterized protein BCR38DRAFT_445501 [Pseudomassariella vexata]|uniref:Uncharacterized protein n=1 Tax=Pseudomassariella vexata TaxID=1141098 RepID=A0A1Y2DII9_9PEZI|nr:uncharacterized protein BCR38DRAFT_445501 [Pseudomassariella vexata]ORY59050.1 hypothetical protein BCR38DRAFT_445501 [Pseudomassariella vexata]